MPKQEKLLPNSYLEVYDLKCTWNSFNLGENLKKILKHTVEHQQKSFTEKTEQFWCRRHVKTFEKFIGTPKSNTFKIQQKEKKF